MSPPADEMPAGVPAGIPVVLHAHSRWSYDADWPLARIGRLFARMGARAVMMTEHDTGFDAARFADYVAECRAAGPAGCAMVPGIEYSCPDNCVHILTWGVERFLGEARPTLEILRAVAEAGGVAVFAHPRRREAWRRFSPEWVPHLAAIEVWNRKTDGLAPGEEALALVAATGLPATVGVDFHRRQQVWPLLNRIAPAPGLPLEAGLVACLRAGRVVPRAFGARVMAADGASLAPAMAVHGGLERLRRGAKAAVGRGGR
jgi:predicted metal-dependent phosphoesterase TrpH